MTTIFSRKIAKEYEKYSHYKRNIYLRYCKDMVRMAGVKSGMTILDLACGTGINSVYIHKKFRNIKLLGIDISPDMVREAGKHLSIPLFVGKAEDTVKMFGKNYIGKIDTVICNSSVQYFDMPKAFSNVHKILKPNGIFVFNIGLHVFKSKKLKSLKAAQAKSDRDFKKLMKKYGIKTSEFKKYKQFGYADISKFLKKAGFRSVHFKTMKYPWHAQDEKKYSKLFGMIASYVVLPNISEKLRLKIWHEFSEINKPKKKPKYTYAVIFVARNDSLLA